MDETRAILEAWAKALAIGVAPKGVLEMEHPATKDHFQLVKAALLILLPGYQIKPVVDMNEHRLITTNAGYHTTIEVKKHGQPKGPVYLFFSDASGSQLMLVR